MNRNGMNTINTANTRGESFFHLVGDLRDDIKTLIAKEINLAKAEMGEKVKIAGRNAGLAAAGGILALFAVFILLLGVGAIVARLLQKADLNPGTAYFLAYMGLGLILGGVGYALIQKAVHAFSKLSFSPEKALEAVRGPEAVSEVAEEKEKDKQPKRSSDDLRNEVIATRARMDSEMTDLKERLTPGYLLKSSIAGIKHHPLRVLLAGAGAGMGGYLYWRNRHMAELRRVEASRKWWPVKLRRA